MVLSISGPAVSTGGGHLGGLRPSNSYDKNMYIFPAFSGFNPYEPFINHHDPLIIHAGVIYGDITWRVIPSLVSVVRSHEYAMNGRGPATRVRKLTITIVANWLLNGMILQVTSPKTHIFAQERIVTPNHPSFKGEHVRITIGNLQFHP